MQNSSTPDIDLTLKRNCSISPQALARLLLLLAAISLGIGIGFAFAGAWLVLPFAGVEVIGLAVAFFVHARHAGDFERIRTEGRHVVVEVQEGEAVRVCELDCPRVRVDERRAGGEVRVALAARDTEVEIGRHMDAARRKHLAATLRRALPAG